MGLINPTLPTGGQPRGSEEVDVINTLTALLNLVNGSLDAANLAAGAVSGSRLDATILSQWRTLHTTMLMANDLSANSSGNYWASAVPWDPNDPAATVGNLQIAKSAAGLKRGAPIVLPFDPADHAVTGMTTQLRLRMALLASSIAPAVNFIGGLYPVSAASGTTDILGITLGAVVAGSTVTRNTPATGSRNNDAGSAFTAPAAGVYALGLNISGAVAADSVVAAQIMLQVRQV